MGDEVVVTVTDANGDETYRSVHAVRCDISFDRASVVFTPELPVIESGSVLRVDHVEHGLVFTANA